MPTISTPANPFKQRLRAGEVQIGLWSVLADAATAEILAGCGYDWLLLDAEHGPNDLRTVLAQLRGIAAATPLLGTDDLSQPVVRLPHGDPALVKQYLDIGVRNLLIPMVGSASEAAALVRAVRYPPYGVRGMGSGIARSSRWGRYDDYVDVADDDVCLVVQIETAAAVDVAEEIAAVDGIDGVLFGPADLAADMGFPTERDHPDVVAALRRGSEAVRRADKPAGIMLTDVPALQQWLSEGITFAGVGVDALLLRRAADELLSRFRDGEAGVTEPTS